jgi:hypothetical protein
MSETLFGKKWQMTAGKSMFSTSSSRPNNETRLYEPIENGYKLTVSGSQDGKPYEWGYTAKYDGKDHPVHGRSDVDAIVAHRVTDHITIGTFKKNGGLIAFYKRTVNPNSTSLTVEMGGRQSDGTAYYNVVEYAAP